LSLTTIQYTIVIAHFLLSIKVIIIFDNNPKIFIFNKDGYLEVILFLFKNILEFYFGLLKFEQKKEDV